MKQTIITPEQINETVLVTIKPSPIHGVGVFAVQDIKKGAKVFIRWQPMGMIQTTISKLKPEVRRIIEQRWPPVRDGFPFIHPHEDANHLSFMNHSDTPNYDDRTDTALRDIRAREELTEDYGKYIVMHR
jgi:SET domain-containing protein